MDICDVGGHGILLSRALASPTKSASYDATFQTLLTVIGALPANKGPDWFENSAPLAIALDDELPAAASRRTQGSLTPASRREQGRRRYAAGVPGWTNRSSDLRAHCHVLGQADAPASPQ